MAWPTITRLSDSAEADFITLEVDDPNQATPVLERIDRPEVDGSAFRKLGSKGRAFVVRGMRNFDSVGRARYASATLRANIKGTLIRVTFSDQTYYDRLMVLDVRETYVRPVVSQVGGIATVSALFSGYTGSTAGSKALLGVEVVVVHAGDPPAVVV